MLHIFSTEDLSDDYYCYYLCVYSLLLLYFVFSATLIIFLGY